MLQDTPGTLDPFFTDNFSESHGISKHIQDVQPFSASFFQIASVESKNPDGRPSLFRQRLACRAPKPDVMSGFFARGIDQERVFRIQIAMMGSGPRFRIRKRKEGALVARIASIAAYEKILPSVRKPIIAGILSSMASFLFYGTFGPEMLHCTRIVRAKLRFAVAAFPVLGLQ